MAYLWSVKKGQFDDLEADGFRMLMEHKPASNREKSKNEIINQSINLCNWNVFRTTTKL